MRNGIRIHAQRANYGRHLELMIESTAPCMPGHRGIVTNLTVMAVDESQYVEPSATMDIADAQELMDALWMAGLRPSEGTGSAGALKAVQDHLSDMRRIAFGVLPLNDGKPVDLGSLPR